MNWLNVKTCLVIVAITFGASFYLFPLILEVLGLIEMTKSESKVVDLSPPEPLRMCKEWGLDHYYRVGYATWAAYKVACLGSI